MKIGIIGGAGYVGLVSGACFSEFGNLVICVDKDQKKISSIKRGILPIYEPGLEELIKKNVKLKRLFFTKDVQQAVKNADAVFIAVGTPPSRRGDGHADLTYVYAAAEEIASHIDSYTVIVNKSTVPIGTARKVQQIIRKKNPKADFDIASNPEFLREGSAIEDFMRPDRVVIGVEKKSAENVLRKIYNPLYIIETPMVVTNLETAELIKYAANSFLSVKISFINEISALCEKVGADVNVVAKGIGMDKRIGGKFLKAGPGYGGSCFPKDTRAIIKIAQENDVALRIVEAAVEANLNQKLRMVEKIRKALGSEKGKTIAVLGVTFKPETDDMREAPALTILPFLIEGGAKLRIHDPQGMKNAKIFIPEDEVKVKYVANPYEAALGADAIVLMTEWNEYRSLNLDEIKNLMKGNAFIDLRNVYEVDEMKKNGFKYVSVGR